MAHRAYRYDRSGFFAKVLTAVANEANVGELARAFIGSHSDGMIEWAVIATPASSAGDYYSLWGSNRAGIAAREDAQLTTAPVGRAWIVEYSSEWPLMLRSASFAPPETTVAVPLREGRKLLGFVTLGLNVVRPGVDRKLLKALQTRGSDLALAVSALSTANATWGIQDGPKQVQQLCTGIAEWLPSSGELSELSYEPLQDIADRVASFPSVLICEISIIDTVSSRPVAQAGPLKGIGLPNTLDEPSRSHSISYQAAQSRRPVIKLGPRDDPFYRRMLKRAEKDKSERFRRIASEARAWGAFPIIRSDTVLGTLSVGAVDVDFFQPRRLSMLLALTALAGVTIQLHQLIQDTQEDFSLASVDDPPNRSIRILAERLGRVEVARVLIHNISNILTPLADHIHRISKWRKGGTNKKFPDDALLSAERTWEAIEDSLSFYHRLKTGREGPGNVTLDELVKRTLDFTRPMISASGVSLECRGSCGHFQVAVRGTEMTLALINLITNAIDALGDLHVRRNKKLTVRMSRGAEHVTVKISDNGVGIPARFLPFAFEEGRTTKTQSGGTGLGLPHALSIIQNAGGTLKLESEEGKGTTAIIRFKQ